MVSMIVLRIIMFSLRFAGVATRLRILLFRICHPKWPLGSRALQKSIKVGVSA